MHYKSTDNFKVLKLKYLSVLIYICLQNLGKYNIVLQACNYLHSKVLYILHYLFVLKEVLDTFQKILTNKCLVLSS